MIGGLKFRRCRITVHRQLEAGKALAAESIALASELVGPAIDVLHLEIHVHDFVFLFCRIDSGSGASSNGFTSIFVLVSSPFTTNTILLVFGSTSTRAISRPLPLAALMARAMSCCRKLLGARWRVIHNITFVSIAFDNASASRCARGEAFQLPPVAHRLAWQAPHRRPLAVRPQDRAT